MEEDFFLRRDDFLIDDEILQEVRRTLLFCVFVVGDFLPRVVQLLGIHGSMRVGGKWKMSVRSQ
jgi:hypothetical protein